MDHPETYTLTRDEWLLINRALAGASLSIPFTQRQRRQRARDAQQTLSNSYDRALANDQ